MEIPGSVYQRLVWLLQVIMLVGLGLSILEQQWLNAVLIVGILLLTFVPMALTRRLQFPIPHEFELLAILFVFASLYLGEIREYYVRFWWWDLVLHMGSAFLLGIVGFLLVYVLNQQERVHLNMTAGFVALFAFAFAVAVGALWEIFEYVMDGTFGLNMQKSGLVDTMWDLIVNTAGALVMAALGYVYMKQDRSSFVERWIWRLSTTSKHRDEG
jgi:hypothetical protein